VIRVLGIDPGSAATGWALVVAEGNRYRLEGSGVIRPKGAGRAERLADLSARLTRLVGEHQPGIAAVESSFSGRNPRSGLMLAESRGAILAVLGSYGLEVESLSPAQVKSSIVGTGRAEKHQVAYMVVRLLGLQDMPPSDAADAMAVAITCLHRGRLGRASMRLDAGKSKC
jgi:crossover junction endodeoxyribonuclease RuvC